MIIPKSVKEIKFYAFFCCELPCIYFSGNENEWNEILIDESNDSLLEAKIYYYSKNKPDNCGKYWHYDEDTKTPIVWK